MSIKHALSMLEKQGDRIFVMQSELIELREWRETIERRLSELENWKDVCITPWKEVVHDEGNKFCDSCGYYSGICSCKPSPEVKSKNDKIYKRLMDKVEVKKENPQDNVKVCPVCNVSYLEVHACYGRKAKWFCDDCGMSDINCKCHIETIKIPRTVAEEAIKHELPNELYDAIKQGLGGK